MAEWKKCLLLLKQKNYAKIMILLGIMVLKIITIYIIIIFTLLTLTQNCGFLKI